VDHAVPGGGVIEATEDGVRPTYQSLDQAGVEVPARALSGQGHGSRHATSAVRDLHELGEVGQSGRHRDLGSRQLPRPPPTVPSRSLCPESKNSRPTRSRCTGWCPDPRRRSVDRVPATLRMSWSNFVALQEMSSPNHLACSWASVWQPTLTSSAV